MERNDQTNINTITTSSNDSSADINYFSCPICLNILIEPVKTSCNHKFCQICLEELIENSTDESEYKCPMCREIILKSYDLKVDQNLDNYLKNKFSKEYQ